MWSSHGAQHITACTRGHSQPCTAQHVTACACGHELWCAASQVLPPYSLSRRMIAAGPASAAAGMYTWSLIALQCSAVQCSAAQQQHSMYHGRWAV
jgi:hypothetical protein